MENLFDIVLDKLRAYCAYQDRCRSEVVTKIHKIIAKDHKTQGDELANYELTDLEIDEVIDILTDEKFLDEKRYAESYVRGKFNSNQWGRQKIRLYLLKKNVPSYIIDDAMTEINTNDYFQMLVKLLEDKNARTNEDDPYKLKAKMLQYASQKGYETDLIFQAMDQVVS